MGKLKVFPYQDPAENEFSHDDFGREDFEAQYKWLQERFGEEAYPTDRFGKGRTFTWQTGTDDEGNQIVGTEPDDPTEQYAWPTPGDIWITQYFMENPQSYPYTNGHEGIDVGVVEGTPVVSMEAGAVTEVSDNGNYGKHITIDHGVGLSSLYAHLSAFSVKLGEIVEQGQVLGKSGNTGRSTGPHLHFTIQKHGEYVNPLNYVKPV